MKSTGNFVNKLSVALILLLCVSVCSGAAFAFFSSSPDAVIVRFSAQSGSDFAKIEIEEKKMVPVTDAAGNRTWQVSPAGDLTARNDFTGVNPGDVLPRDIRIKNTGTGKVWVRVELKLNKISAFKSAGIDDPSRMFMGIDADKWEPGVVKDNAADDSRTWVYYWKNILNAPRTGADGAKIFDSTDTVLTGIRIPESLTAEQIAAVSGFALDCTAASVQADGFDSAKAAFDAAFPETGE